MIAHLEDADNDDAVQPGPRPKHTFDLDASMGHQFGKLVDRHLGRCELAEPSERHPHGVTPNCSRNRTSPSISTRMSGIAYRSSATRSTPRPNANPVYRSAS